MHTKPEMSNRVEQIALHVRKLAQATGVEVQKKEFNEKDAGLDGVTSDLDIEALSKGLLDVSRDLDLYLQGLLNPPELPVVTLKAVRHSTAGGRAMRAASTCNYPLFLEFLTLV